MDLREVGELLAQLRQPEPPRSLREAAALLPLVKTMLAMKPKTVSKPACQEIVWRGDDIDLGKLPVQTCWPGEPAPLITWPLVVTKGPGEAREDNYNLGIYRMQVLEPDPDHHALAEASRRSAASSALGDGENRAPARRGGAGRRSGDYLAAVTPVPETLSEYQFAGLLRGQAWVLADCVSQPLKVPAEAEIVIEGTVSLADYATKALMAITPAITIRWSSFPSSPSPPSRCGKIRSTFPPTPRGRRTNRRSWAKRSTKSSCR